ncbi:unnamed protein product [Eruca vesicaria subsp. sativa]|uniref:KIB1-4 beta-propeller domain-containing protein n=1 Tax=Eruca vesicaria subsp. sativa TaxID=29727 RepID=A0ABC8MAY7_ERUVS|nr:unnamed protein product [Eruca vesicaria subsp. sativa]
MELAGSSPTLSGSPGVMLFPKHGGGCILYNPKEGKIERNLHGDFPGCRFLANSGNWFLVLDSESNLYIIDVFSKKTIHLPSLESLRSTTCSIKRVGDKGFLRLDRTNIFVEQDSDAVSSDVVRGLLWVDEGGKDYVVVWFFDHEYNHDYISFCKKGILITLTSLCFTQTTIGSRAYLRWCYVVTLFISQRAVVLFES